MEQQANGSLRLVMTAIALSVSLGLGATAFAQGGVPQGQNASNQGTSRAGARNGEEEAAPAPGANSIDAQTGKVLNEAIELLNMENYQGAAAKINTLTIDKNLTITAIAGTLIVAGNQQFGIFTVASSVTATIGGLTITGGRAPAGGGVLNHGTLSLLGVVVSQNTADGDGGGIESDGTLTVLGSLITMNTAAGGETGTGRGGGIDVAAGSLTLGTTTVSLNQATGPTTTGSGSPAGGNAPSHGIGQAALEVDQSLSDSQPKFVGCHPPEGDQQ